MPEVVEDVFSFGIWVRRRRKALDLTQAALSERVGCAEVTIRKLEAEAFRPSREIADRLASCLEIPPDDRELFIQVARAERSVDRLPLVLPPVDIDRVAALAHTGQDIRHRGEGRSVLPMMQRARANGLPQHNLPAQAASLIGREREMTEVATQLLDADVRLLTLTGPGGVGKTRLALRVAVDLVPHFCDGVFFVPLAGITDPLLIPATVTQVLGIQETAEKPLLEGLTSYLADKELLLILDNFEQILAAAPIVAELLGAAPRLRMLITSRALLHVYGELHFPVPSLAYPHPEATLSPELLRQCEAIQLFIDRARVVRPDYPITDVVIATVAQICQRLDGLPLAIELAAARMRLFSPAGILARMDHALPFLKGVAVSQEARHQTLEHTIAWSYDLLSPAEQMLFRRMAVFSGGCTLEAVAAICDLEDTPDLEFFDGIQALLDKSLLRTTVSADGEPRFSMLETIHQFARKQLAASGEAELIGQRHAAYYQTLVEQAEPRLFGDESIVWLERLETEYGNLRTALEWLKARPDGGEMGLCLAGMLWHFWDICGQFTEGRSWLDTMLAHNGNGSAGTRAKALAGMGALARQQGDYAQAQVLHEESLSLWTVLSDTVGMASAHVQLGLVAYNRADFPTAKDHLHTALAILEHVATPAGAEILTQALNALGKVHRGQSDFEQARNAFQQALVLSRTLGNRRNEGEVLTNLGGIENCLRRYSAAQRSLSSALAIKHELKDLTGEAIALHNLAVAQQETYQYSAAKENFLAALQVHQSTGNRREQINVKLGLGVLYYQIGDLVEAQRWLQQALRLSGAIGDGAGKAYVLANLGPVLHDLGDLPQAAQILQEGGALAERQEDKGTHSYCLSHLAMVYLAAGRASDAIACALQALTIRREIDLLAWTTTDLATLAAAHLALGQHDHAHAYADEAVAMLRRSSTHESELPQRDYFTCYQLYAALGQIKQAHMSLQMAYAIVVSRAAKIPEPASHQSFLERVPMIRTIVREAQRVLLSADQDLDRQLTLQCA